MNSTNSSPQFISHQSPPDKNILDEIRSFEGNDIYQVQPSLIESPCPKSASMKMNRPNFGSGLFTPYIEQ